MTASPARSKKLGGDTSQNNTFSNSSRKVSNTFLHTNRKENSPHMCSELATCIVVQLCQNCSDCEFKLLGSLNGIVYQVGSSNCYGVLAMCVMKSIFIIFFKPNDVTELLHFSQTIQLQFENEEKFISQSKVPSKRTSCMQWDTCQMKNNILCPIVCTQHNHHGVINAVFSWFYIMQLLILC